MVVKIASVGPQGSGKTRSVLELANALSTNKYTWNEDEQLAGTSVVKLFTLNLDVGNILVADNPGQNSLEMVRKSVAQSGADYAGIVIFVDAIQFNFREIGLFHAISIAEYINQQNLPVAIVTTKADLIQKFFQTDLLKNICQSLENTVQSSFQGQKISYYDRSRNQNSHFTLNISNGWIGFLEIEQILINSLDELFSIVKVPGFTKINIRLFVRAMLLGYGQFYKERHPEYIHQYPVFNALYDDESLINSLNYNRPSAIETGTPWRHLAAQSKSKIVDKNEPPFQKEAFSSSNIEYVLKQYSLATPTKLFEWQGKIKQKIIDRGWNFLGSSFSECITDEGLKNMLQIISKLASAAHTFEGKHRKKNLSFDDI